MNPNVQQQKLDSLLEQLLFIRPLKTPQTSSIKSGFNLALLISAIRCIVQYVVLPFVLPLIGIVTTTPTWLGLLFNTVAFIALISSLRRIWQVRHPKRFAYLPLAIMMLFVMIIFTITD